MYYTSFYDIFFQSVQRNFFFNFHKIQLEINKSNFSYVDKVNKDKFQNNSLGFLVPYHTIPDKTRYFPSLSD